MKLIFRVTFKISLIITIWAGFAAAEEIKEADPSALLNQGAALIEEGQYDRAITCFNRVIEIDPKDAVAYRCWAFVYLGQDHLDKVIADFNTAIALDQSDARAYNNRSVAYF